MKIQILGAGGMGSALAYLIGSTGHEVEVADNNPAIYESWKATRRNNLYPYLEEFEFPETVRVRAPEEFAPTYRTSGYDFTIAAVGGEELIDLLGHLHFNQRGGTLVLLQKSLQQKLHYSDNTLYTPYELALIEADTQTRNSWTEKSPITSTWPRKRHKPSVITMTGAAFARDLINRIPCGMILAAHKEDEAAAERFKKFILDPIGSIWAYHTREVEAVGILNALRTIASCQLGIIDAFLKGDRWVSTNALAAAAINQERLALAEHLLRERGHKHVADVFDRDSRVYRVLEADMLMCRSHTSRNYETGYRLGRGANPHSAAKGLLGTVECGTTLDSLAKGFTGEHRGPISWPSDERFVYLNALWRVAHCQIAVQGIFDEFMARIPRA